MVYDNSNPLEKQNFLIRAQHLAERGEKVVLTVKKVRTLRQNAYLHVILAYFAALYGESEEYVKQEYFKKLVNPDFFIIRKVDKFLGEVDALRSTADLTTEEMTTCIERFRNWSAKEAQIYLPSAEEGLMLQSAEMEIARHIAFI